LFDVDIDPSTGEPVPQGILEASESLHFFEKKNMTGCIFLTNRVFLKKTISSDSLARKVAEFARQIGENRLKNSPKKLLIDCDWTATTRENYFLFLKKIQQVTDAEISATIRLHQFHNPEKTGVPPVEEGVLMCYNTGEIDEILTENSILDSTDVRPYFAKKNKKYPLRLDIALPIFRWAVIFREGDFWKILNDFDYPQLIDNQCFTQISPTRFLVNKETFRNFYGSFVN
jgi:hypothetical protein